MPTAQPQLERVQQHLLERFTGMTLDLVLSEFAPDRSDGATLVQSTRALAGIEGIPVVLLDESAHESRRAVARAAGAAGYVILPPDMNRFVTREPAPTQDPQRIVRHGMRTTPVTHAFNDGR